MTWASVVRRGLSVDIVFAETSSGLTPNFTDKYLSTTSPDHFFGFVFQNFIFFIFYDFFFIFVNIGTYGSKKCKRHLL